MNRFFIGLNGYYEGDRAAASDVEVLVQRPDWRYLWNGNAWVLDAALDAIFQRLQVDNAERTTAKLDATITALINQDKAAWIAWVTANLSFCVAAADRNRMGTIFWVLSIALRGLLRN